MQYMRAFYGFERPNMRSLVSDPQARISKGLVFRKAQASLTNSRLAGQFNRTLSNSGFFAPIDNAASAAIDNVPTWASCTGYIGNRKPLGSRLAALVSVCTTWLRQSGKMTNYWNISTRHAHLVWKQMEQEAKSIYLLLPL